MWLSLVERCVRELILRRDRFSYRTAQPLVNSHFIGGIASANLRNKPQRPHKIPQTRIFSEIGVAKKLNIEVWLSLVEHYVRDVGAASSNLVTSTIKMTENRGLSSTFGLFLYLFQVFLHHFWENAIFTTTYYPTIYRSNVKTPILWLMCSNFCTATEKP